MMNRLCEEFNSLEYRPEKSRADTLASIKNNFEGLVHKIHDNTDPKCPIQQVDDIRVSETTGFSFKLTKFDPVSKNVITVNCSIVPMGNGRFDTGVFVGYKEVGVLFIDSLEVALYPASNFPDEK